MRNNVLMSWLVLIGVVGLAITLRFYDITSYPAGLYPQEVVPAEDAQKILAGDHRVFYSSGGFEPMFSYLVAGSIKLFGEGVWQVHAVSALVGSLTVLVIYFATQVWFGRLAGLLAALFMATSYWHVTLSRSGFSIILVPLLMALFTVWSGWAVRSVRQQKKLQSYLFAYLAGLILASGFYAHSIFRVMGGVVVGIIVLLVLAAVHPKIGFPHFKRYGGQLLIGLFAVVMGVLPLVFYLSNRTADLKATFGQMTILDGGSGELVDNLGQGMREVLMSLFAKSNGVYWFYSVVGFPLLNALVGILFLLGFAWIVRGFVVVLKKLVVGREVHMGMIYAYLLFMVLGVLATVLATPEEASNGFRLISLALPIFMLAGVAASVTTYWCKKKFSDSSWLGVCYGVIVGLVFVGSVYDVSLYFLVARNDTGAYADYRNDLVVASGYIKDSVLGEDLANYPYLVSDEFSVRVVRFLVGEKNYRLVDPTLDSLPGLLPGELMVFIQRDLELADEYEQLYPAVELVETRMNRFGQEVMRVYGGMSITDDNAVPAVKGAEDSAPPGDYGLDA